MEESSFGVIGGGTAAMNTAIALSNWKHRVTLIIEHDQEWSHAMMTPMRERQKIKISQDLSEAASLDYVIVIMEPDAHHQWDDWSALKPLADHLRDDAVLIISGTVPIGAGDALQAWFKRREQLITVVSSPTLSESETSIEVEDFHYPTRFILGVDSKQPKVIKLRRLLAKQRVPILVTTRKNAEVMKYATQAYYATTSSLINQLALYCEQVGADVQTIARGMGMERYVGQALLERAVGIGEATVSRDLAAFIEQGRALQIDTSMLEATQKGMMRKRNWVVEKLTRAIGSLKGKKIAVWGEVELGVSTAAHSDTLSVVKEASRLGAITQIYNAIGLSNMYRQYKPYKDERVLWCSDLWTAIQHADALIILSAQQSFKEVNLYELKRHLGQAIIIDGGNLFPARMMEEIGFNYISIGRKV